MVMTLDEAYSILGVSRDAEETIVKSAYKKLALRTHPDKNPNDPDARHKFQRISEAYKRIVDPSSFKDEEDETGMEFDDFNEMFQSMFEDMLPMFMMMGGGGGPFNSRHMGSGADRMFNMMAAEMMMGGMGMGGMHEMYEDDSDDEYYDEEYEDENADDMQAFARAMGLGGMGGINLGSMGGPSSKRNPRHAHHHNHHEMDSDEEMHMMESMIFEEMMGGMGGMGGMFGMSGHPIGGAFAVHHAQADFNDDWLDGTTSNRKKSTSGKKKEKKKSKAKSPKKPARAPLRTNPPAPAAAPASASVASLSPDNAESDSDGAMENSCFLAVNDRVIVQNKHVGTVKYAGPVHYAAGTYVGVEMDQTSVGKNNGTIKGVKYFTCRKGEKSGLMVRVEDVRPLSLGDAAKLGK